MANSYTAIPNIVPGNLRVQGNLTVAGGQFILGALQRKYRIQELANGNFYETVNLDTILGAQDDPAAVSGRRRFDGPNITHETQYEPAGNPTAHGLITHYDQNSASINLDDVTFGATNGFNHILKNAANINAFTFNLERDLATRDDATKPAYALVYDRATPKLYQRLINAAGSVSDTLLRSTFWLDRTVYTMTGTTGQQTVASKTILANQLGPMGGIYLLIMGNMATGAGGQEILGINWAGVQVNIITFPQNTNVAFRAEVYIQNDGATNSQYVYVGSIGGTTNGSFGNFTNTADTTVNQNLSITSNATLVGDNLQVRAIEGAFVTSPQNL